MIRNIRYKYIWNLTDVDEFYDLEADPYELRNAIYELEYKDVISQMQKQLQEDLRKCEDRILGRRLNMQIKPDRRP
jgi:hypothetical protein